MSQEVLAEKAGMTRTKLAALENGATKNPPLDDLIRFSDIFNIGIDHLVRVDLSKLGELRLRELETGVDLKGGRLRILTTSVAPDGRENVEVVTTHAKAGYASGYADPDFIAQLPVFHMPTLPKDRKYRMFPIAGDSMHPIPHGAQVIVEYVEDWTAIPSGTPCIVITHNDGIVFKLVDNRLNEAGVLTLRSLNANYAPYDVQAREIEEVWKFYCYLSKELPDQPTTLDFLKAEIAQIHSGIEQLRYERRD